MQAAFCFSDDLKSTVVNPSCFSNCLQPQNLLQPAPSPAGEGWGEGILRITAIFPNAPTTQNTSLAACCPLSNSLPRGERTGWLLELRVLQGKQVVQAAFCFSDDLQSTANPSKPLPSCKACALRTHSPFSLQPQPTACVPCSTHPADGFKGRLKKRSRRLFHLPCDKGYLKNSRC